VIIDNKRWNDSRTCIHLSRNYALSSESNLYKYFASIRRHINEVSDVLDVGPCLIYVQFVWPVDLNNQRNQKQAIFIFLKDQSIGFRSYSEASNSDYCCSSNI